MYVRAMIEEGVNEQAILVPQQGVTRDPKGNATALVVGPMTRSSKRTQGQPRHRRQVAGQRRAEGGRPGDRGRPAEGPSRRGCQGRAVRQLHRSIGSAPPAAVQSKGDAPWPSFLSIVPFLPGSSPSSSCWRAPWRSRPAGLPVSGHRAAGDLHQRRLSRRLGQNRRGHRHPGHRAEDERDRPSALYDLDQRFLRRRDHHPDLRRRHRPEHRPGAGAEQTAAGHAAPAAGGAAAGHPGHQIHAKLSDDHRPCFGRRQHEPDTI